MKLNHEEIFKIYYHALQMVHLHPDTKRNLKWLLIFVSNHSVLSILFSLIMYNIAFVNVKNNDFSQICKNGTLAVIFAVTSFHRFIMIWKERQLTELMDSVKNDYVLAEQMPAEEQEIVQRYARETTNICKMWRVIAIISLGFFPFINLILITYYWAIGEFHLIPLYDLVYPSFIENKKDSLFIFSLTYILFLDYGCSCSFMITAFVPLGPCFMLHACGQLEVLKKRIEVLFNVDNDEEVLKKLKEIGKQLQYIYAFVDRINLSFSIAYEVTLKASTIVLPITCYEVLASLKRNDMSMEFVMFIIGGFLLDCTLCFYSDLLMEKSEELRHTVYSCGWEKMYDRRTRSTVYMILLRAKRPMAIRTLFDTVCLHALTELLHQSYLLFNLMNAAWN